MAGSTPTASIRCAEAMRLAFLAYGALCYAVFLATFLYARVALVG